MGIIPLEFTLGREVLVDTCFFHAHDAVSLTNRLHLGIVGLDMVDLDELKAKTDWCAEAISCLRNSYYATIPEVITEVKYHIEVINQQKNSIENSLKDGECDELYEERMDKMSCLQDFSDQIDSIKKMLEKNVVHLENRYLYRKYLDASRLFSKDFVSAERADAYEGRRRVNTFKLETDCRLVAAAYSLAYKMPVIIATRDKNLGKLSFRLFERMVLGNFGRKLGIYKKPQNEVAVYNPDQCHYCAGLFPKSELAFA